MTTPKESGENRSSLVDDLNAIEVELEAKKRPFLEAGRTLSQIQDEVHAIKQVVVSLPDSIDWSNDLGVLSTYAHGYRQSLRTWDPGSELGITTEPAIVTSGSALYSVASTAFRQTYIMNQLPQTQLAEALNVRRQREDRDEIQSLLEQVSSSLANSFIEAWQSLESSTTDPARGPAYLMRHVLSQVPQVILDRFVGARPKPDHQTKRIELIADMLAKSEPLKSQLKTAARSFRVLYEELSVAHQAPWLDREEITALLYRAQDLLGLLLRSIRVPSP